MLLAFGRAKGNHLSKKPFNAESPTMSSPSRLLPPEALLCAEELARRARRAPDYETENRAMVALALALANAPGTVLQTLAEKILEVLKAGSAGVSLLTEDEKRFYWPAVAGIWQGRIGGGTPRDFSPCAAVLDCSAPLLFKHPEHRYPYFQKITPLAQECLLIPFYIDGKAIGTIWAINHDNLHKFDTEDLRQLESLSRFASAAYRVQNMHARSLADALHASRALEKVNAELRMSEEFNRSIIDSSPDCIKVLDLNGNLLSMRNGHALLGIEDIRPFLNKSWIDFWTGKDRLMAQTAVASAAAGGAGSFVGFFRTLSGEPKWWDVAIAPILGLDGKPERLLSVSRDVTQRRRAEMNLEFLAGVSHDFVRLTNIDEMMRTVGRKLAEHLNLSICAFVEINEAADQVVIFHEWHRDDGPALLGVYCLADFVGAEFVRIARAGEVIIVRDTANDARTTPERFAALNIASFICVPLIRDGQWRFAICLYHSEPYDWRKDEIELARELTTRMWMRLERMHAEATLRESETRYRALFDSIDEGFCIIEKVEGDADEPVDFRYIEANAAMAVQSGISDVVGKTIRQKLPDISEEWFLTYDAVLKTGEPIRFERAIFPNDRMLELYAFRVEDKTHRRVAVIFQDITERTQTAEALRQSEERFRALFDLGPIAMYSCNASGEALQFNRVAVALWGMKPKPSETDEGFRGAFNFYLPDGTLLPYAETPMTQVLRGTVSAVRDQQIVIERPDGSRITVVANIVPLKNRRGEITGAINSFYDITGRSLLEKKAHEQTEALGELQRRKDEFLAMLSHELRNPLAPISNAVQLLGLQKNADPVQQLARGIIERQVGQLTRLIEDLMEVSRVTTGRIHLQEERLALGGIVEHAVETVRPLIEQQSHSLKLSLPSEPIWLFADAARLEQVIVNLLTNAAKYTLGGGSIWLSISQEGDEAVLRVRDTGIGISSEMLPHIFDLFTQADRSLDRAQGGLGIGLCLVQLLVELHGGTVVADSTLGKGSEFIVRLPVMQTSALLPASLIKNATPVDHALRVLIVEDSLDAAETLAMLLELSGHAVRKAHDGLTALDVALEYRPQVVLLDIGLPGMDGFEVAKRLRQLPSLGNVVLIAMTGYGEVTARERSRDAGFDHHLVKPADFEKVQEILANVAGVPT